MNFGSAAMPSRRATLPPPWCARSSSRKRRRTSRRMSITVGALMSGETGALLVAFRLTSDPTLADDVYALVRGNVDNPTDDISWGAPGTLLWVPETRIPVAIRSLDSVGGRCQDSRELASSSRRQLLFTAGPARGHDRVKRALRGILFSAGAVTRRGRIRG